MKIIKNGILSLIAATFAGALFFSPAGAQANAHPLPGQWDFATRAAGIFNDNDDHCLTQAEVNRFFSNPCKRNSVCVYKTKVFKPDGSMYVDGTWTDRKKRVTKVKASGQLTSGKMYLKGTATQYGIPIPFTFTATRVAASCSR